VRTLLFHGAVKAWAAIQPSVQVLNVVQLRTMPASEKSHVRTLQYLKYVMWPAKNPQHADLTWTLACSQKLLREVEGSHVLVVPIPGHPILL